MPRGTLGLLDSEIHSHDGRNHHQLQTPNKPTQNARISSQTLTSYVLLPLTAKGLSSAALYASKLKRLTKYSAKNLTTLSPNPPSPFSIPCKLPIIPAPPPPTVLDGIWLDPKVYPLDWKFAPRAAGPEAASATALRTAAVRAEGFAPRMVSVTEPDFRTRKVGMLYNEFHVSDDSYEVGRIPQLTQRHHISWPHPASCPH